MSGTLEDRTPPADPSAHLAPNRLVPMTARVKALSDHLAAGKKDAVAKARAFDEYLVDNGTYDKTTPAWGKGDSERFCDVKKGNCTDFHSAFMALARAQGIPVRFFIGFPVAYLFGNLDPNRFEITTGRDLVLAPPQRDGPVNFFIYPYVEVDGKAWGETKIRLEYHDL